MKGVEDPELIPIVKARHRKVHGNKHEVTVVFPDTQGYFERTMLKDNEGEILCVHYHRVKPIKEGI